MKTMNEAIIKSCHEYPVPQIMIDGNRLFFNSDHQLHLENQSWDAMYGTTTSQISIFTNMPDKTRAETVKANYTIEMEDEFYRPANWNESWKEALLDDLYYNATMMQVAGDFYPALNVPRFLHGHSQGICDIFGVTVKEQPDGYFHAYPLAADPAMIMALTPESIKKSRYYHAVEYMRYAYHSAGKNFPVRNPVITGPLDTANYILGTTTLLEWVYIEPEVVHHLLEVLTDVLIEMYREMILAVEGAICPRHFHTLRGGFDVCSEVRSLISLEIYEIFEAPYLRRIGEVLGTYGIHSCGSWERTVASALDDPNLRAMNGQIKENDLAELCGNSGGNLVFSIGRSVNVHDRFMWDTAESYYRHVIEMTPDGQPLEVMIETEDDIWLWQKLYHEIKGRNFELTAPMWQ